MNTLYIIVTNECNMKCPFCYNYYNNENFTKKSIIDVDKAVNIATKGYKISKDKYIPFTDVIFHGGEPLLYPDIVYEIYSKIKEKREDMRFSIQTNLNYDYINNIQLKVLASIRNYGTSYSYDRYDGNEDCLVRMINNVRFLNSFNINNGLLVTLTEKQILMQSPEYLLRFINENLQGIKDVIFERQAFSYNTIMKDKKKYEEFYRKSDEYLYRLAKAYNTPGHNFIPSSNIINVMKNAIINKTPFYPNHCSDFTISIYPNDDNTIKLKYGCPSREEINIPYDEEFANKCYTCSYFPYCKGDCECFNNICTFPKKWFNYIKENCID